MNYTVNAYPIFEMRIADVPGNSYKNAKKSVDVVVCKAMENLPYQQVNVPGYGECVLRFVGNDSTSTLAKQLIEQANIMETTVQLLERQKHNNKILEEQKILLEKTLQQNLKIWAQIQEKLVVVEAMKTENSHREQQDAAQAYDSSYFFEISDSITVLAKEMEPK